MGFIGYSASLEQFHPNDLVRWCQEAEDVGMGGVFASEHFHPWTPEQGQSAFVWTFFGALGQATKTMRFGTGVTCPTFRFHPAVVAHAAATTEAMFPGRFYLGLGSGEALNEHVVGGVWPEAPTRLAMMMEAVEIIQKLFTGKVVKHDGKYFTLESAKLYTMPDAPPPIYIATAGPITAERTGKLVEGLITVGAADEKIKGLFERFERGAKGAGKDPSGMPKLIQIHTSWDETDAKATENAVREWPNGGMPWPKADVRYPEDFQAMAKFIRPENFKNRVLMSADWEQHRAHIQKYIDLGFDEIYVHNCGRNQSEWIAGMGQQVMPNLKWPAKQMASAPEAATATAGGAV